MKCKHVVFLLILVIQFFGFCIHGKTEDVMLEELLICSVHVGSEEDLEIEGMHLMSSNVNFKKAGSYVATYFDPAKERYFERSVVVAPQEDLLTGVLFREEITTLKETEHVKRIVWETEDSFYVVGNIDSKDNIIQTNYTQTYGFVRYYKGDSFQWTRVFEESYSDVSDAVLVPNGIVVWMSVEIGQEDSDLRLLEITNNNQITRELSIGGNEIEWSQNLYWVDSRLYCFFDSNSTAGTIAHLYAAHFIGVIIVDYGTFTVEKKQLMGNNQGTDWVDVEYHKAYSMFFLLTRNQGTQGTFRGSNQSYTGTMLVGLSLDGAVEHVVSLKEASSEYPLFLVEDAMGLIVVSSSMVEKNVVMFTTYDATLTRQSRFEYMGDKQEVLTPEKLENNLTFQDTLIALKDNSQKDKKETSLLFVHVHGCERLQLSVEAEELVLYDGYGYYLASSNRLYRFVMVYGMFHKKETHQYKEYKTHAIFVHFEYGGLLVEARRKDQFGEYNEPSTFVYGRTKLVLDHVYYVPLITNIKDLEIYDLDTAFTFNGVGYLNGKDYVSGTPITKVGQFELVIVGNNERRIYNFEIRKISVEAVDPEIFRPETKNIHLELGSREAISHVETKNHIEERDEPLWLVALAILVLFAGAGWVVPTKKGRK